MLMAGMSFALVVWRRWRGFTPPPIVSAAISNPDAATVNMSDESFYSELLDDVLAGLDNRLRFEAYADSKDV